MKRIIPFIVIIGLVLSFFWKVFWGQVPIPGDFVVGIYYPWLDYKWDHYPYGVPVKNLVTNDVVSYIFPVKTHAIDILKAGDIPLWNELMFAGTPLLANFQSAVFSPTNFIYLFLNKTSSWTIQIILQHILAAVFTFLLLRRWKVSVNGAVLGGVIYAFSGFSMIWSQWNGHVLAASFIPLALYFTDVWLRGARWFYGMGLSLTLFFQILSGYPQVVYYSLLAVMIFGLILISSKKTSPVKGFYLVLLICLGIGLAAFQILPGLELVKLSQRTLEPVTSDWVFLPWEKVITFIAPDYFGNPATQNYWSSYDFFSNVGFVGVVAFSLSLFALRLAKKNIGVLFSLVLIAFSLILSFPTPISIYLWKSGLLGFNANAAHRALCLFNLGVALLAGYGYDELKPKFASGYKWVLIIPFAVLAGYGLYAFKIHQIVGLRNLALPVFVFFGVVFTIFLRLRPVLILFSVLELFYFGWKYTPFSYGEIVFPDTPILQFLQDRQKPFRVHGGKVVPVNMLLAYSIETFDGYDAVYPMRTAQFIAALNSGRSGTSPMTRYGVVNNTDSPLLDLVNVKYYLALNLDEKVLPARFKLVFQDKSVSVLESKAVLPRSFYVDKWEVVKDGDRILDRLLDPKFNFAKTIILEEEPPEGTRGFIFTSETFYPGWKAYADGVETKIYRADFAFRAVPVSSAETKVEYRYEPTSFSTGLKISVVSLVLLLVLVLKLCK